MDNIVLQSRQLAYDLLSKLADKDGKTGMDNISVAQTLNIPLDVAYLATKMLMDERILEKVDSGGLIFFRVIGTLPPIPVKLTDIEQRVHRFLQMNAGPTGYTGMDCIAISKRLLITFSASYHATESLVDKKFLTKEYDGGVASLRLLIWEK